MGLFSYGEFYSLCFSPSSLIILLEETLVDRKFLAAKPLLWFIGILVTLFCLALLQTPTFAMPLSVKEGKVIIPQAEVAHFFALDGDWLLSQPSVEDHLQKVPGVAWTQGYGTYTLQMDWEGFDTEFELYTINAGTSYRVVLNDTVIGSDGTYGESSDTSFPSARPKIFSLPLVHGQNTLQIQVSNFVHPRAGLWEHVYLGKEPNLTGMFNWHTSLDFILFGQVLLFAFMQAFLTIFSNKKRAYIWFALGAFCAAFGPLFRNTFAVYMIWPSIDYLLLKRFQVIFYYLASGFFIKSFVSQIRSQRIAFFFNLFLLLCFALSLASLFLPFVVVYTLSLGFFPILGVFLLYRIYDRVFRITSGYIFESKISTFLPFFADLVILYGVTHDFLFLYQAKYTYQMIPVTIYVYVALYSIVFAQQYILANRETEEAKNQLIKVSEMEKRRIADDLHDGVGQFLHSLDYITEGLLQAKTITPKSLSLIHDISSAAVKNLKMVIDGLNPVRYGSLSLDISVQEMANRIEQIYSIPVSVHFEGESIGLDGYVAQQLHYLYSEALKNAVEHAKPSHIVVKLAILGTGITGSIQNDGVKDVSEVFSSQGHGIAIMKYRIEQMDGVFAISNLADNSLVVTFRLPRREGYDSISTC